MTPRGIRPIRRATAVHLELHDELAAMPDQSRSDALLAIEEALVLLADALALPSEADGCS